MRFSVIIPAYNEGYVIEKLLKRLVNQSFKDFEIIVVYGGDDNTPDISREYTDRVYREPRGTGGPAKARNYGAKKARGEILAFIDADTWPSKDWLSSYNKCFGDEIVGAGGPVFADSKKLYLRFIYWLDQDLLYRISSSLGFHQFSGNNCAYRRKNFLAVGGFNERTTMLEDVELAMRMKTQGKEVFCRGAWVRTSTRRFEEQGFWRIFFKNMKGYLGLATKGRADVSYFKNWEARRRGEHKKKH